MASFETIAKEILTLIPPIEILSFYGFLPLNYTHVPPEARCQCGACTWHKPQWHRHGRCGSAVFPSLITVAPETPVKTADLRGGTAETLNMFKTSAVPPRVGPIRNGIAAALP